MKKPITHQIYEAIFDLLEQNPNGIPWSKINKSIAEYNPEFHAKTINGCVWKLLEKFPDKVYKPSKGLFRLTKYK